MNPIWQNQTNSAEQTMAIGATVSRHARAGDVIALAGELGAGKTQFVRGMAQGIGLEVTVTSPTFVVVQEYLSTFSDKPNLVHIDAYRLKSLEDLESIGWDMSLDEIRAGSIVAIEWADRLEGLLGEDMLTVELAHAGDDERDISIITAGSWIERQDELVKALNNGKENKQSKTETQMSDLP